MGELSTSSTAWSGVAGSTCSHFTHPKRKVLLCICKIVELAWTLWRNENLPLPEDREENKTDNVSTT
jgi:hypothetical protein